MRVLITHRPGGAYGYISDGWQNALRAAGHSCERWDGAERSWADFGPDLYVGVSGHRQPIPARRGDTAVAIHVNPYCATNIDGINETQNAIGWTRAQAPDVVFGYGHEVDREYWGHWETKLGIPWAPLPTAGDSTVYKDLGLERNADFAYVGGYWPYKARNIDKYLVPLYAKKPFTICGWGDWPSPIRAGDVADADVARLYSSARVVPCVSEPHTTKWGIDLPERLWKAALCGALVVHDPVANLHKHMPSAVMAADPADYLGLCAFYGDERNGDERAAQAARQRSETMANHTYFKRMATLFAAVGAATGRADFTTAARHLGTLT